MPDFFTLFCFDQLSWTGDKALKELHEANLSLQSFPILQQCAKKVLSIIINVQFDEFSKCFRFITCIMVGPLCG